MGVRRLADLSAVKEIFESMNIDTIELKETHHG